MSDPAAPTEYGWSDQDAVPDPDEDQRPGTVTAAAVLTIIASVLTTLMWFLAIYGILVDRDRFVERIEDARDLGGVSAGDIVNGLVGLAAVGVVWCLVAILLAILTLHRSNAARVLLIISAAVSALLSLPGVLAIYPIITLICGASVVVMLSSKSSREWFAR